MQESQYVSLDNAMLVNAVILNNEYGLQIERQDVFR